MEKSKTARENVENFKMDAKKLFDISACKCNIFLKCTCLKESKVPKNEQSLLIDQRTERKMFIGSVDVPVTKRLIKRKLRKEQTNLPSTPSVSISTPSTIPCSETNEIDTYVSLEREKEVFELDIQNSVPVLQLTPSVSTSFTSQSEQIKQMRTPLANFAAECDRHGVSDRSAAKLATAVLQDLGIIHEDDKSKIIDRNKVRRERHRVRKDASVINNDNKLIALFFDGRKDMTMKQEKKDHKFYSSIVKEEHITLVQEPCSNYIGL